jgi:ABC-type glycerol-3-phosphate transport system permease component
MHNARAWRQLRRHVLIYAGLVPFLIVALFPVVWSVITAFKEEAELYRMDGNATSLQRGGRK